MINWISNYVIESRNKSNSLKKGENNADFPDISLKIPQKPAEIPDELRLSLAEKESLFKKVDDLDFNCFEYSNTRANGLVNLMYFLFDRHNLFEKLSINQGVFAAFVSKIQKG